LLRDRLEHTAAEWNALKAAHQTLSAERDAMATDLEV
jgi:hypothetical protein